MYPSETIIISNQVKCLKCGDRPYSSHVHDMSSCECGSISVDGGASYLKRSGDLDAYEELAISASTSEVEDLRGIVIENTGDVIELVENLVAYKLDNFYICEPSGQPFDDILEYVSESIASGRNSLGVVYSFYRAMRDEGLLK